MGTINYLFRNREKATTLKRTAILVVKRLLTAPRLIHLLIRPIVLRTRGATIGRMTVLGSSRLEGKLAQLIIGDEVSLGQCNIAIFAKISIGNRVVINDGAQILSATHNVHSPFWETVSKPISIGDYVWIATNAIILPGAIIESCAVIGAGAVVTGNVRKNEIVAGNPAKVIGHRSSPRFQYIPTSLAAPFEAWLGNGDCYRFPSANDK